MTSGKKKSLWKQIASLYPASSEEASQGKNLYQQYLSQGYISSLSPQEALSMPLAVTADFYRRFSGKVLTESPFKRKLDAKWLTGTSLCLLELTGKLPLLNRALILATLPASGVVIPSIFKTQESSSLVMDFSTISQDLLVSLPSFSDRDQLQAFVDSAHLLQKAVGIEISPAISSSSPLRVRAEGYKPLEALGKSALFPQSPSSEKLFKTLFQHISAQLQIDFAYFVDLHTPRLKALAAQSVAQTRRALARPYLSSMAAVPFKDLGKENQITVSSAFSAGMLRSLDLGEEAVTVLKVSKEVEKGCSKDRRQSRALSIPVPPRSEDLKFLPLVRQALWEHFLGAGKGHLVRVFSAEDWAQLSSPNQTLMRNLDILHSRYKKQIEKSSVSRIKKTDWGVYWQIESGSLTIFPILREDDEVDEVEISLLDKLSTERRVATLTSPYTLKGQSLAVFALETFKIRLKDSITFFTLE